MTEPVIFGLLGLYVGQQQPCSVSQVMLSVNISSLGCNFLTTSKPWFSFIGSLNFMLTALSLFLYIIIWDIILIHSLFLKYLHVPHFSQFTSYFNPMAWSKIWPWAMGLYQPCLPWCNLDMLLDFVLVITDHVKMFSS
jgi:hypothetical protein